MEFFVLTYWIVHKLYLTSKTAVIVFLTFGQNIQYRWPYIFIRFK